MSDLVGVASPGSSVRRGGEAGVVPWWIELHHHYTTRLPSRATHAAATSPHPSSPRLARGLSSLPCRQFGACATSTGTGNRNGAKQLIGSSGIRSRPRLWSPTRRVRKRYQLRAHIIDGVCGLSHNSEPPIQSVWLRRAPPTGFTTSASQQVQHPLFGHSPEDTTSSIRSHRCAQRQHPSMVINAETTVTVAGGTSVRRSFVRSRCL